ncbi:MAG: hypothetical protein HC888_10135 [Candidatus Competibacteraceae bacterium]|nr:hypothetical protein [Candidatus Competibacteraceae bacterium]
MPAAHGQLESRHFKEKRFMRFLRNIICILALSYTALAQTQNLQYYRISNLTSAYPFVDNRSQATRYADYYGFCATGTGTWSVTIQFSDVSISGPWSSFSVGGLTVTNASTSCYGFASGYHAFLRFNITGTASVDFTGSRGFYYPGQSATGGGGGGDVLSVFGRTGAVTAQTGDYNITQITNGVDATVAYTNPAFIATLDWSKLINIPSYQLISQKGVADGYASLNGSALVPASQLCNGSASSGSYCDGGTRSWTAVPGGGGGSVTSVFGRTAAVTAQTGDYNTDQVPEGISNLYSTTTRIRNAISGNAPVSYSTSTGIISMPAATSIADGYLTSANWITFNAKENALTFNAPISRSANIIRA